MSDSSADADARVLAALGPTDVLRAADLQQRTLLSQPTVSRALARLRGQVLCLGSGKNSRYALGAPLLGLSPQVPAWWFDEAGVARQWGVVSHLRDGRLHLAAEGTTWGPLAGLPWPLAGLRRQGFLGRLAAEAPALKALLGTDVEAWTAESHLYAAAVAGGDLPGALAVADTPAVVPFRVSEALAERTARYEAAADDVARALAPGSSAGGEQPKFLALVDGARPRHVLVKFSPPRSSPFGERWNDLLHAEALALGVLAEAGHPVAAARVVVGPRRTFLESVRFDRVGVAGRKHVLALDALHDAFVPLPRQHWAQSCDALAHQRRLARPDADRVRLWRAFGRLIANTDMHFGNLSLWVDDVRRGRFSLAPCYDMLPMQYRPGVHHDDVGPTPFTAPAPGLEEASLWPVARELAQAFWQRAAQTAECSGAWREVCAENAKRVAGA
jgi:hypothetical protein